jgi:tetratricopeptide (TPR) repeat protein
MQLYRQLLLPVAILLLSVSSHACGNSYYYKDQPLPLVNGFLDYHRLFINSADSGDRMDSHMYASIPYFFPMEGGGSKSGPSEFRDAEFRPLYDSIIKLAGSPKNAWKLGYQDIGMRAFNRNADFKLLSDYSWKLAQKGELNAALTILTALVKKYPNEYNILANLGTLYELLGKPRSALDFLSRAVKISPESHYGSEWLHIHILQMKLGEISSYDFTRFFALENAPFGYSDNLYTKKPSPESLGHFHRDTLMIHLAYQLHERMYFIPANDEVMGEMLYMFMQCMLLRGDKAYTPEAAALCIRYLPVNKRERVFSALAYAMRG